MEETNNPTRKKGSVLARISGILSIVVVIGSVLTLPWDAVNRKPTEAEQIANIIEAKYAEEFWRILFDNDNISNEELPALCSAIERAESDIRSALASGNDKPTGLALPLRLKEAVTYMAIERYGTGVVADRTVTRYRSTRSRCWQRQR